MKIKGIHKYEVTPEELELNVADQWGEELPADELDACRQRTQEHFDGLYLVEVESDKEVDEAFDWGEITQDNGENQVPYDEQPLDTDEKRWIFFFHFLDLTKPLKTPFGDIPLPRPTPRPEYLSHIQPENRS